MRRSEYAGGRVLIGLNVREIEAGIVTGIENGEGTCRLTRQYGGRGNAESVRGNVTANAKGNTNAKGSVVDEGTAVTATGGLEDIQIRPMVEAVVD